MNAFWKNWLTIWCWGVALFGAGLAGFAFEQTQGFTSLFYSVIGNPVPADPSAHLRFAMGLMGCISIGWAITFAAAFRGAHQLTGEAARGVWRLVTLAVAVWFVIDSLISIATGFPLNAVSNIALTVLYFIPVLRSNVLR
jgi:hypothetical protein